MSGILALFWSGWVQKMHFLEKWTAPCAGPCARSSLLPLQSQVMMVELMNQAGTYTGVTLQAALTGSDGTICLCGRTFSAPNKPCKSN